MSFGLGTRKRVAMIHIPIEDRIVSLQLRRSVERFPDRVFLQTGETCITYAEFDGIANTVANGLIDRRLGRGDKVALMLRNSLEFVACWFAAARMGAVYVPINTEYKGDILRYQLDKADVSHIVIDAVFLERLDAIIGDLPKLKHVVIVGKADARVSFKSPASVHKFGDLTASPATPVSVPLRHTDPHAISFTSGTTGPSKGVLAVNCHVVTFAFDWITCTGFRPGETVFSPLPQFHAIAAWLGILPVIMSGGRFAFIERFSASTYWDDVRRYKADIAHGVFSMIPILLKQPAHKDDANQPARAFYIGQHNAEFEARFNCKIVEVYGATETGIVTACDIDGERRPGSCGRVNSRTFEVALVNDDDEPVEAGKTGEIVVRPKSPFGMIQEYYNMPNETLRAFRNLWFHTGDNGRQDKDGFYYFVDRKKDAIRRRGENISSFDVEVVATQHPAVFECAALAVPSEMGEDEVKIAVVLQEGKPFDPNEFWDFCERNMPSFWVPRYIEIRKALPKTANQKVQKYLLREGMEGGVMYDRGPAKKRSRTA